MPYWVVFSCLQSHKRNLLPNYQRHWKTTINQNRWWSWSDILFTETESRWNYHRVHCWATSVSNTLWVQIVFRWGLTWQVDAWDKQQEYMREVINWSWSDCDPSNRDSSGNGGCRKLQKCSTATTNGGESGATSGSTTRESHTGQKWMLPMWQNQRWCPELLI